MFIDPCTLFDETLEHLETLSVYLADEIDEAARAHPCAPRHSYIPERHADQAQLTLDARRCKEALLTIKVLIPKLREARSAAGFHGAPNQLELCPTCD
jgi:hypothetical protein